MSEVTIHGHGFSITEDPAIAVGVPMNEGHVKALQAARVASLRNRFNQAWKGKEVKLEEGQAAINEAAAVYQFGVSLRGKGGGRRIVDPVERKALELAKQTISMAYEARYNAKPVTEELRAAAEDLMQTRGDDFRKRARAQLREMAAAGTDILDSLGLGAPTSEEATQAAA